MGYFRNNVRPGVRFCFISFKHNLLKFIVCRLGLFGFTSTSGMAWGFSIAFVIASDRYWTCLSIPGSLKFVSLGILFMFCKIILFHSRGLIWVKLYINLLLLITSRDLFILIMICIEKWSDGKSLLTLQDDSMEVVLVTRNRSMESGFWFELGLVGSFGGRTVKFKFRRIQLFRVVPDWFLWRGLKKGLFQVGCFDFGAVWYFVEWFYKVIKILSVELILRAIVE